MKRLIPSLVLVSLVLPSGCRKQNQPAGGSPAGTAVAAKTPGGSAGKKTPLSRAAGEKKFNQMDDAVPVGSSLADVVRVMGQEPDRMAPRAENQVAIWVLDDGSEIEVEFYMGRSGSTSATFTQKK